MEVNYDDLKITPSLMEWLSRQEPSEVDDETLIKIGQAFYICSHFPDVFGDVPLGKFRTMFLKDDETLKAEMYRLLQESYMALSETGIKEELRQEIDECLTGIDEEAISNE